MEHCTQGNRLSNMEKSIENLHRDIHGQGDEIGVKGAIIKLSESMDNFNKILVKRDKTIDSIMDATRQWETSISAKKLIELKEQKQKQNLKWFLGVIIGMASLLIGYLGLK